MNLSVTYFSFRKYTVRCSKLLIYSIHICYGAQREFEDTEEKRVFKVFSAAVRDLDILLVSCNKIDSFSASLSAFQNFGLFLLNF